MMLVAFEETKDQRLGNCLSFFSEELVNYDPLVLKAVIFVHMDPEHQTL